eukprot:scaffold36_cov193-Alexandrium_tamarense.AAC.2
MAFLLKALSTNRGRLLIIALLIVFLISLLWDDFISSASSSSHPSTNSYEANIPLFEAVKANDLSLVRSLLESAPGTSTTTAYDVNAEDPIGITPLIEATLLGSSDMVNLLLSHGARAQPLPGFRHTALRAACLTANPQLITLLIQRGADVNAKSEGGRTPLMGACFMRPQLDERGDREELSLTAVQLMMEDTQTDPTIRNSFGESALDLCRKRDYTQSVEFLEGAVEKWEKEKGSNEANNKLRRR